MRYISLLSAVFLIIGTLSPSITRAQTTSPRAKHVIMIGLDAFSSRGLQKAATPAMNEMIASGALAPYARCVLPTVSTPNWTSMLNLRNLHDIPEPLLPGGLLKKQNRCVDSQPIAHRSCSP